MIKNFSLVFFIILFSGCSIFPKVQPDIPVSYFDIGSPAKIEKNDSLEKIEIEEVKTIVPYNDRMVFRDSETHLLIDDYNRWASPPNDILMRYLTLAFNQENTGKFQKPENKILELHATIICLEANLKTNEARIVLFIELKDTKKGNIRYTDLITETSRIEKMSAEGFASAFKVMTDRIINSLSKNISQIKDSK